MIEWLIDFLIGAPEGYAMAFDPITLMAVASLAASGSAMYGQYKASRQARRQQEMAEAARKKEMAAQASKEAQRYNAAERRKMSVRRGGLYSSQAGTMLGGGGGSGGAGTLLGGGQV